MRDIGVTGVQTCALPILLAERGHTARGLIRNPEHAADVEADGGVPVVCDLEHEDVGPHVRGADAVVFARSEQRRVGKECRSRWSPFPYTKIVFLSHSTIY